MTSDTAQAFARPSMLLPTGCEPWCVEIHDPVRPGEGIGHESQPVTVALQAADRGHLAVLANRFEVAGGRVYPAQVLLRLDGTVADLIWLSAGELAGAAQALQSTLRLLGVPQHPLLPDGLVRPDWQIPCRSPGGRPHMPMPQPGCPSWCSALLHTGETPVGDMDGHESLAAVVQLAAAEPHGQVLLTVVRLDVAGDVNPPQPAAQLRLLDTRATEGTVRLDPAETRRLLGALAWTAGLLATS